MPPEQEEGESQENIQRLPNFTANQNQQQQEHTEEEDVPQEMEQDQEEPVNEDAAQIELTDEQLIELIQNAHNLSPD